MTDLKQSLEAHIEKEAEKYAEPAVGGGVVEPWDKKAYLAGAQSLAPILLAAVEAIQWIREDIACDRKEDVIVRKCDELLSLISASLKREE